MTSAIPPKPYLAPIAIPPGQTIREMLDDRGMSQKDLALRMGRPAQMINEIIQGKKAITAETAAQLEAVLGLPQKYWLNREASYQAAKERIERERSIEEDIPRLSEFPYAELAAREYVPETSGRSKNGKWERVLNLRRFLRVANFTALDKYIGNYQLAARLARTSALTNEKLSVWLRLGEYQAEVEGWTVSNFKKNVLVKSIPELRRLSRETDSRIITAKFREIGEAAGVVFLFVKEFKGFPTKGMTVWINQRPYVMLTLHGKSLDMLWFTLFHEIGHILFHERKIFIDGDNLTVDGPLEDEANEFARDALINPVDYARLRSKPLSPQAVEAFADKIELDPCIVVGRLMHERLVRYDNLNYRKMLRKVQWVE